jgi:hypothetical protein
VNVEHYQGDNGVFKTNEFKKDLLMHGQTIDYAGVGAHHQLGVAERVIQIILESARAMLLHAAIHWPNEFSVELWPFTMDYAVYLWNHMLQQDSKIALIELWCGWTLNLDMLRLAQVFGCLVYVLDPKLQDGKKLPHWKPKSQHRRFSRKV